MVEANPLLSKIQMPGRRFRLPSRGLFYTNGELDENVIDGEVEVFSMTAIDEISLRSPEFLFNGEAIERVFLRCIPEVKKPLKLLSKDVDFLLTALRVVSYGDILDVDLRCEKCQEMQDIENFRKEQDFLEEVRLKAEEQNIPLDIAMVGDNVQERLNLIRTKKVPKRPYRVNLNGILTNQTIEISKDEFKKYKTVLSNGQQVDFTPLKMDGAVLSYQFQNDDFSKDLSKAEDYIAFVMTACILKITTEVDGKLVEVGKPEFIAEWAKKLPISLKNEVTNAISLHSDWGTNFDYTLECPDCGHKSNASTLLNPITFFMLPSNQETLND